MEFTIQTLSYLFIIIILLEVIHIILSYYLYQQIKYRRGPQGLPGEIGRIN